jgi:hypothetical protein
MVVKKVVGVVDKVKSRIEQAKQEDVSKAPWVKQVAMLTGVLAAMSGFLDVRSTTITNDAIYQSNQAILAQSQASDAWNEYQANSIKARIVETALLTNPKLPEDARTALSNQDKDLRDRQGAIKQTAVDQSAARDQHLKDGLGRLSERDILGYAGLAAQIGIALASVAALVRWRAPFIVGICMGVMGMLLAAYALAHQYGLLPNTV